ncbi:hypothetical protein [Alcaligenes faecalis]|uniref:hypothetical protein n=1 Tax=Alcaligenes faecalis TaxID=511 RepID=UPI0024BC8660|nr:hypothetical protein [Alcaligenes faecalis]WHQ44499.1 hypothetical protein E8D21_13300 [Alcaligenes faecalis]
MNFIIKLCPQVPVGTAQKMSLERLGTLLKINEEALDLSFMSPGDVLPAGAIEHPLLKQATVTRHVDSIEIDQLLFQIAADQTDPAACFPEPFVISEDGLVALPAQSPPPAPTPELPPETDFETNPESEMKEETDADQH